MEDSIRTAIASLQVEGLEVSEECIELCRAMLEGKISMEEYIHRVTSQKEK